MDGKRIALEGTIRLVKWRKRGLKIFGLTNFSNNKMYEQRFKT